MSFSLLTFEKKVCSVILDLSLISCYNVLPVFKCSVLLFVILFYLSLLIEIITLCIFHV